MSNTVCYSALNPRPLKKRKKISSILKTYEIVDDFDIVDSDKKIVNVKKKVIVTNEIDTDKVAQSFSRTAGIKALAKRVAFSDLGTIYDESGNILDATNLPTNIIEAQNIINAGKTAQANFNAMPKELTKNMSAEDFVKTFKQEDLINYINNLYNQQNTAVKENKEDN